jgi:hypothetical protein
MSDTKEDPKVLILDIDSTLIYASGNMDAFEDLKIYTKNVELRERVHTFKLVDAVNNPGTGTTTPMWFVYRPYYKEFLEFALEYFDEVRVWSAGKYKYVHAIVNILFKDAGIPDKIKTFDDCIYDERGLFKPLSDYSSYPSHNIENMLILDDRDDTFSLNPKNGIHIPPYEPSTVKKIGEDKDIALLQFACWLSIPNHRASSKLTTINKERIFKTSIESYLNYLGNKLPFPLEPESYVDRIYRRGKESKLSKK